MNRQEGPGYPAVRVRYTFIHFIHFILVNSIFKNFINKDERDEGDKKSDHGWVRPEKGCQLVAAHGGLALVIESTPQDTMDLGSVAFLGQAGQAEAIGPFDGREWVRNDELGHRTVAIGIMFVAVRLHQGQEVRIVVIDVSAQVLPAVLA